MKENIELIDSEYGAIRKDERLSSNQIKTRAKSFSAIKRSWSNFILSRLNDKLDNMKNDLVSENFKTDSSSNLTASSASKIEKRTTAIAKLEEKIKVLSREKVPQGYVSKRAIKLREKMIKNLRHNSANAYSVGIENYDKIFGSETSNVSVVTDTEKTITPVVPMGAAAMASTEEDIDLTKVLDENEAKIAEEVKNAMNEQEKVVEETIDRSDIEQVIGDQFAGIPEVVQEPVQTIERTDIDDIISSKFTNVSENNEEPVQEIDPVETIVPTEAVSLVTPEEVAEVVGGALNEISSDAKTEEPVQESVPIISREEVESEVDSALQSISSENEEIVVVEPTNVENEVGSTIDRLRITQNNSTEAKVDLFDQNGAPKKKYNYTPMTDEEIAASRAKLEMEKYEEIYRQQWEKLKQFKPGKIEKTDFTTTYKPVDETKKIDFSALLNREDEKEEQTGEAIREAIVVVPERDVKVPEKTNEVDMTEDIEEYTFEDAEVPTELHMDYSDATENDVVHAFSRETSISGLEALKLRALKLKEENKKSKEYQEEAYREQQEEARRALEVKKQTEKAREAYALKVRKLEDFCAALEEDTKINISSAEIAINDTECNRRFIQDKVAEMSDYEGRMDEIDSIISPEAKNVRRR